MIEVQNLCKRFGKVQALAGASFTARDGVITALLGPNGAGKTTLLRTLVGLLQVDPMTVRRNVGLLTDQFGLYERLTTREYLRYFGELNDMEDAAIVSRTQEVAELLSLEDIIDRRAKGFSQGQRIKVALARTLLHRPRHLLLDEPSRGLDVMSTRALRRALAALKADGCCVIMATHVMQEVIHSCDDVIVIANGTTVTQGTPQQLCEQAGLPSLEDAFVRLVGTEEGIEL
jgi:sodium transport system ATP-binding protein